MGRESASRFAGQGGAVGSARRASRLRRVGRRSSRAAAERRGGQSVGKATPGSASDGVISYVFRAEAIDSSAQQPFPADWRAASVRRASTGRQRLKLAVGRL